MTNTRCGIIIGDGMIHASDPVNRDWEIKRNETVILNIGVCVIYGLPYWDEKSSEFVTWTFSPKYSFKRYLSTVLI